MSKTVAVAIANTSLLVALIFGSAHTSLAQSSDSVSGTVFDIDGKSLAGVQVTAQPAGDAGTDRLPIVTQTDKSGRYRFEGLAAGNYVISAKRLGENGTSIRATFSRSQTTETTFFISTTSEDSSGTTLVTHTKVLPHFMGLARVSLPDADNSSVDMMLMKSAVKVSGRVVVPPGFELPPSLRVSLSGTATTITIDAEVLANGTFEFPSMPPDTYDLRLLPNLGVPMTTIVVSDRDIAGIELGGESKGVRVRGRVPPSDSVLYQEKLPQWVYLEENGERVPTVQTTFASVPSRLRVQRTSSTSGITADFIEKPLDEPVAPVGPDGEFEFLKVSPGVYSVRTLPEMGFAHTTITVEDGVDLNNLQVGAGVRVRGEVVPLNFGRRPPELINLTIAGPPGGLRVSADIEENGQFEFPNVGPGTYRILLDGKFRPDPPEVTIGGDDAFLRVETPFRSWVSGRVVFSGKHIPTDSMTSIYAAMTNGYNAALSPDGAFKLKSNDGEYEFFLSDLPDGCVVKSMSYGGEDLLNKTMKVDATSVPREVLAMVECSLPAIPTGQ